MRTSDRDLNEALDQVVTFLKNQVDWIPLTRLQLSQMLGIPTGYKLNKVVDALRYHPNIACKYGSSMPNAKSCGHVPLLYKYVETDEEKYKLSLTPEAVSYMTPEQYMLYEPTINKIFPDKKDRLFAFRLLDLLFCQHYDIEWQPINLQRLVVNIASTPRKKIREFIQKFSVANILLISPDHMYRIASTDKKENKKHVMERIRTVSNMAPKLNELDSKDLTFDYLSGLNNISSQVTRLQELNSSVADALSDIVLALNHLQETDHVIKTSDITFIKLNDMYQELRQKYKAHVEAEKKIASLLAALSGEPLTGNSMRTFREINRILSGVLKEDE